MPFHVAIDEALVLDYLADPDRNLSDDDIETLMGFIEGLADTGDRYRNEPERRRPRGSSYFEVEYLFLDTAGRTRCFRFIIADDMADYSVLRVCYVDE